MRIIGHLEGESAARHFGDFLYVHGMPNTVEQDRNQWAIWVHEENDLETAGKWLDEYRANPTAPNFASAANAPTKREQERKELAEFQKRTHGREKIVRQSGLWGMGPLTLALIAISIGVAILSRLGEYPDRVMALFITSWNAKGMYVQGLPEIRHGEVWRLVTPIFIHFNFIHIFFNMLWLRDLGAVIERREGSLRLAVLVLLAAAGSNLAQYLIKIPAWPTLGGGSPMFGGMSGVVYALLGYIWMRGKLDPGFGFIINKSTVTMMMIWLVICFTGMLGPIANLAHVFGLLIGVGFGYATSVLRLR